MTTLAKRFPLYVKVDRLKTYKRTAFRVGYRPSGKYNTSHPAHNLWLRMLGRCYCKKSLVENPSYLDVDVCEEWHNFQVFAEWANNQPNAFKEGFQLDKDLTIKGSKIYSPETCSFVPREINSITMTRKGDRGELPIGVCLQHGKYKTKISKFNSVVDLGLYDTPLEAFLVYKEAKESHIKALASIWRDYISTEVYNSLMTWEINIDD